MAELYISKIAIPGYSYPEGGHQYHLIKDAEARQMIEALGNPMHFIGVSNDAITDGGHQVPSNLYGGQGQPEHPEVGDVVIYNNYEFVCSNYSGTPSVPTWQEFSDLSHLKVEEWSNNAITCGVSGTFTPAGTVSAPTFTGSSTTSTGTFTPAGTVSAPTFSGSELTSTGTFTPAGTVSAPTFRGSEGNLSVTGTPTGSVSIDEIIPAGTISVGNGTANYTPAGSVSATYTPAGTVSAPTFSGSELTSTGTFTPAGTVSAPTFSGSELTSTATYTPEGSIGVVQDGYSVVTAQGAFSAGTLPTLSNATSGKFAKKAPKFTVNTNDELLTISWATDSETEYIGEAITDRGTWTAGTAPSLDNATSATIGFSGTQATISVTGTPEGTVSQPTFSGTEGSVSVTGTPAGTVSQPTFSGTEGSVSVTGTPAGTVSQPTFTGTEGNLQGVTAEIASGALAHSHTLGDNRPQNNQNNG